MARDYHWTAAEVWEMVKGWPEEARPASLVVSWPEGTNRPEYAHHHHWSHVDPDGGLRHIIDHHAAHLHAYAGLEWLMRDGLTRYELEGWGDDKVSMTKWEVLGDPPEWKPKQLGVCPTLLHAVDAAVRAVAGEVA